MRKLRNRIRKLIRYACSELGVKEPIVAFPHYNDKALRNVFGMLIEKGRAQVLAVQTHSKDGVAYSWRFIKSVIAHELTHKWTSYHTQGHSALQRRMMELLNRIDKEMK